jgi:signal transduction histidine kinase/CheY-like chemotaxis protein
VKTRSGTISKKHGTRPARQNKVASKGDSAKGKKPIAVKGRDQSPGLLGWWALEGARAPLALVEGRRIAVGNRGFAELTRKSAHANWERADADDQNGARSHRGLTRLLVSEVEALTGGQGEPVTRLYRRVGEDEYLEASYWRMASQTEPAKAVVMIHEATARVQAERELVRIRESLVQHERMRAIGELASGVAHDLNNTLHAMSLRLSILEQSEVCRSAQGGNIAALTRAINDAALVVGRLQDFARQKADRSQDCIDLPLVVGEAIDMVRTSIEGESSLEGAPIRIRTSLPPLPPVKALASELRHVVVNLLLNARDALPQGGTIELMAEERDGRNVLEVRDDGSGIPARDLENIFSPFFTTKGARGTGLGLSNARAMLGRLGGEIRAQNRTEGGASFELSFPIAAMPKPPRSDRMPSEVPPHRRVLVVDDDRDNLQATKMVMELHGQSVDIAESGAEALARLVAGSRYDIVICDLGMPEMNGWRLAREIHDVAPGTTVYLLTGWAQHIKSDDPRRRWVKAVLQKPMRPEMMRDLLTDDLADEPMEAAPPSSQAL